MKIDTKVCPYYHPVVDRDCRAWFWAIWMWLHCSSGTSLEGQGGGYRHLSWHTILSRPELNTFEEWNTAAGLIQLHWKHSVISKATVISNVNRGNNVVTSKWVIVLSVREHWLKTFQSFRCRSVLPRHMRLYYITQQSSDTADIWSATTQTISLWLILTKLLWGLRKS